MGIISGGDKMSYCPTCGFSKTVITTPGGEEPASQHPVVWSPTEGRWIDIKEEEKKAEQAAAAPAAAPSPAATGFEIPSLSVYWVILGTAVAGVIGYFIGKKRK